MATVKTRTNTITTVQLTEKEVFALVRKHMAERFGSAKIEVDADISSQGLFKGIVVTHTTPTLETETFY